MDAASVNSMDISAIAMIFTLGALLAASAGIRAFIPPFFMACAGGLGWVTLPAEMQWLATPVAIGTLAVAIVLEILADKVPVVDHAMDAVHLLVKPAAGALTAAALLDNNSMIAWTAAILGGGAVAGATHVAKASVRVGSTATTAGTGNPILSIIEDVVAIGLSSGLMYGVSQM